MQSQTASSPVTPRRGTFSADFVKDRSCNYKRGGHKPLLAEICEVFQSLVEDKNCVFGQGLTTDQAKVLGALAKPVELKEGDVLCTEGARVSGFSVIIRGKFSESIVGSESRTRSRGSVIGEVGLLAGLDKGYALITALEDSVVAHVPYEKFIGFLERSENDLATTVLGFVTSVLFPELMQIEGARMRNSSALVVQCAMRQCWAVRKMYKMRQKMHHRSALRIQKAWRSCLPRLIAWREFRKPWGVRLQSAIRMMIARKRLSYLRKARVITFWYVRSDNASKVVQIQRFFRLRKAQAKRRELKIKRRPSGIERRPSLLLGDMHHDQIHSPLIPPIHTPDSDNSVLESPLGTATRKLALLAREDGSEDLQQEDLVALQKWLLRDMNKCLTAWKRHCKQMRSKRFFIKGIAMSMMFGTGYRCFKKWKNAARNASDLVTPWRAKVGQKVMLSPDGKEYEFSLGRRMEGDDGHGVLVSAVVTDKTVWNVRWQASGLIGAYFTGSCGRYFLKKVDDTKKNKSKRRGSGDEASTLRRALGEMRLALENNKCLRALKTVSPPFGATIGFPCPAGTDWILEVNFAAKSVSRNVAVHLRAIESAEFGCSRNELGVIVSPVIQVRHRTFRKFQKPFTLRIPHRCSSKSKLYLYHWPEEQVFCNKVQGAVFTDEVCTAEVEGFGLYAVINANPIAPDVVFGRLDVGKRWRDNIGKMVTRMMLGTTHPGCVTLLPRGCAEDVDWASPLLPQFHVMNGTLIESIEAIPEFKLEGCMLNSWSGRVKYRGGLTPIKFNIIIQTVPDEPLPFTMPLFNCSILLMNHKNNAIVAFENGNHVRMKVTTVQLCISVEMPPPLSSVHYECMLQGRETLRDIRTWVAKCFAGAKIDNQDLDWFSELRFVGLHDEIVPLNVETLDPASNHLPKVKMVRQNREGSETPEDAITRMSFELIDKTQFIYRAKESAYVKLAEVSTGSQRLTETPLVGCPSIRELRESSLRSWPSACTSWEPLLHSASYSLSPILARSRASFEGSQSPQIQGSLSPLSRNGCRNISSRSRETTRATILSKDPRIPQTVFASPRTPGEIDIGSLKRFSRALNQYGCSTPRQYHHRGRKLSATQDPETLARIHALKMQRPLITPRSQRVLEHRREWEEAKVQEALGRMFSYQPGTSRAPDEEKAFVRKIMDKNKAKFTGPVTPEPSARREGRPSPIFLIHDESTISNSSAQISPEQISPPFTTEYEADGGKAS